MKRLKGNPVNPGISIAKAFVLDSATKTFKKEKISENGIETELNRFRNSVRKTKSQLKKISQDLEKSLGKESALIIDSQFLLLDDSSLTNDIESQIESNHIRSEWAIKNVEEKYIKIFNSIQDLSFREKKNDISDLLNRVLDNLKESKQTIESGNDNIIIIAEDIPPSVAAYYLSQKKILGLVLERGCETSHSVILSKTLEIPTIIGSENVLKHITSDDIVILDGLNGDIYIRPGKADIDQFQQKREKYALYREKQKEVLKKPDLTKDQSPFQLSANIEFPFEGDSVVSFGAKGIGLFRTEFLFTDPANILSEDEQYLLYKKISQTVFPNPLTIRTFDVGRDKTNTEVTTKKEVNPALGTMALRIFLHEPEILENQIRAILRANENGNIKMLFPMVTEFEEIVTVKKMIDSQSQFLMQNNLLPKHNTPIGVMIEIPAMVKLIPYLSNEVDFFSLGTNDLLQYLLAVDRNNIDLSHLYNPFNPSVIETLIEIQHKVSDSGLEITVCGEMAGKGLTALLLLGIGFEHFSMNPTSIVEIKRLFTTVDQSYLHSLIPQILSTANKTEIKQKFYKMIVDKYPEIFKERALL